MTIATLAKKNRAAPRIVLSARDYKGLSALARAAMTRTPQMAVALEQEIGRARVLGKHCGPQQIVRMNSEVEFRDEKTGKLQRLILVYPSDADIMRGKLSVLTPVVTALIGVRVGHSTSWRTPAGEVRRLTVLSVEDPATVT